MEGKCHYLKASHFATDVTPPHLSVPIACTLHTHPQSQVFRCIHVQCEAIYKWIKVLNLCEATLTLTICVALYCAVRFLWYFCYFSVTPALHVVVLLVLVLLSHSIPLSCSCHIPRGGTPLSHEVTSKFPPQNISKNHPRFFSH